jgi:tetratricopeptide (TPR) repeat protein
MASKTRMQIATDRALWSFAQLLNWHLSHGTRPSGTPDQKGVPWQNKEFANSVGKESSEGSKSERTIRNWRNGDTSPSPADLSAILQALFGGKTIYANWRAELTNKYHPAHGEQEEPELSAPASPAPSLPVKPLRCLGRDDELKSIVDALVADRDNTAVLVLGGPGMGKTTLAREAAVDAALVARFGQHRWFVELETSSTAEAMQTAIMLALGLDPAATRFQSALARLGQAPGLLVLDNLETPWDGERAKTEALLATLHRVPDLTLLASIRGNEPPAGIRWTRQRTMHPLEWPHDRDLFLDFATDIREDDPDLAPLLSLFGGVPIVIELVAQESAAHDTLAAIHEEWQRVGIALARRRGIEPSRLSSLEVSLELSFQSRRLGDAGRRLFSILGQLPAGIAPEDLKGLLGDAAFEARQGLLSTALAIERGNRLDLLPPVRDHAVRLHQPGAADENRWWAHYLALARDQRRSFERAEGADALRRVANELSNLEAALRAAIAAGTLELAIAARGGIVSAMVATGLGSPAYLRDLADACRAAGDLRGEAGVLDATGFVAFYRSDYQTARKAYEQALLLHRQAGNKSGEAYCIRSIGEIALVRSDHEAARTAYEQALALYRLDGDINGEANCIRSLGTIALQRGDGDEARKLYEQALPLYRQIGDILGEANCIRRLGEIAFDRSEHDVAQNTWELALPLYRQLGNVLGEANCIRSLGDIAFQQSNYDAARKAYEEALQLYNQVGDLRGAANSISCLGDVAIKRSDRDGAREAYKQALALYQRIEDLYSVGHAHYALARVVSEMEGAKHLAAARAAWLSIGREDLVKESGLSNPSS